MLSYNQGKYAITPCCFSSQEMIVCVLDMDETLGYYDGQQFVLRPKLDFFMKFLKMCHIDVVLWSMGDDDYVKAVVNSSLSSVADYAVKIFGHKECKRSYKLYDFHKASEHVRIMYPQEIFLIGVDDRASTNMDPSYDVRIAIKPYKKFNPSDRELMSVVEKIVEACVDLAQPRQNNVYASIASTDYGCRWWEG